MQFEAFPAWSQDCCPCSRHYSWDQIRKERERSQHQLRWKQKLSWKVPAGFLLDSLQLAVSLATTGYPSCKGGRERGYISTLLTRKLGELYSLKAVSVTTSIFINDSRKRRNPEVSEMKHYNLSFFPLWGHTCGTWKFPGWGWIGATAASLWRVPNPLGEARDQTCTLMDISWISFHCTTTGTPGMTILIEWGLKIWIKLF